MFCKIGFKIKSSSLTLKTKIVTRTHTHNSCISLLRWIHLYNIIIYMLNIKFQVLRQSTHRGYTLLKSEHQINIYGNIIHRLIILLLINRNCNDKLKYNQSISLHIPWPCENSNNNNNCTQSNNNLLCCLFPIQSDQIRHCWKKNTVIWQHKVQWI